MQACKNNSRIKYMQTNYLSSTIPAAIHCSILNPGAACCVACLQRTT